MRKIDVILLLSAMITLALTATAVPVRATATSYNWVGDCVLKSETDSFLGYVSAGYETGKTAVLKINIYNHLPKQMNISGIKIRFDWGINYSSTEVSTDAPFPIAPGMSHVFTLSFTVPDLTTASNVVKHTFRIFIEDVNSTTGPKRQLNSNSYVDGSDFAVLSSTQTACVETKKEIAKYSGYYYFITAKARELSIMAAGAKSFGDNEYLKGNFGDAAAAYDDSLGFYQDAVANETDSISGFEKAFKDILNSSVGAISMAGWGYLLFGLGWVFIGIGIIIYSMKKTAKPAASSQ
ncbi:MAG: hypothetical protein QHH24_02010 [Candidatus Bathyarchaeota archaeon]|jgi:hypothetical protein|nr:hypothetical protein [Candidatus Bathyarchaeota archaeon]